MYGKERFFLQIYNNLMIKEILLRPFDTTHCTSRIFKISQHLSCLNLPVIDDSSDQKHQALVRAQMGQESERGFFESLTKTGYVENDR